MGVAGPGVETSLALEVERELMSPSRRFSDIFSLGCLRMLAPLLPTTILSMVRAQCSLVDDYLITPVQRQHRPSPHKPPVHIRARSVYRWVL